MALFTAYVCTLHQDQIYNPIFIMTSKIVK